MAAASGTVGDDSVTLFADLVLKHKSQALGALNTAFDAAAQLAVGYLGGTGAAVEAAVRRIVSSNTT